MKDVVTISAGFVKFGLCAEVGSTETLWKLNIQSRAPSRYPRDAQELWEEGERCSHKGDFSIKISRKDVIEWRPKKKKKNSRKRRTAVVVI